MTPRPCTWPDGGCGEPIIDTTSAKTGKRVVLDPTPVKGVILGEPMGLEAAGGGQAVLVSYKYAHAAQVARVTDVYTDHHATCRMWLARVERERAAEATEAGRG